MNREALKKSLREHEGISLVPYLDSEGNLTIGIGTCIDKGITIQQAYALAELEIDDAITGLNNSHPDWKTHPDGVQVVLCEMAYQLGVSGVSGFKKMWKALESRDYKEAARQMLDSKWHKQTPGRAETLAKRMELADD